MQKKNILKKLQKDCQFILHCTLQYLYNGKEHAMGVIHSISTSVPISPTRYMCLLGGFAKTNALYALVSISPIKFSAWL